MTELILTHEPTIRLAFFLGGFVLLALVEAALPRKVLSQSKLIRWTNNLTIVVFNTVLLRIAIPVAAVAMAVIAGEQGWGLLNNVELPGWAAFLIAVLVLDLAIYAQHVAFHHVPLFWRFHRMHHADQDIDVTTGLRFHPVEIILSMLIKLAVVAALGPAAVAVIVFEVVLNATSMFNHANIRLPLGVDKILRLVLVTPDMHRVHHSVHKDETNSNFGFNVPWWDRLFRTYRAQPRDGHDAMQIGLHQFRGAREQWLDRMLIQPIWKNRSETGGNPISPKEKGSGDKPDPLR